MPIHVLFVEDEADLRTVVVEALTDQGFAVTAASNGVEAISELRGGIQYSMVVTDVCMPEGVSGLDVAAEVAHSQPQARVMVVSGLPRAQLPPLPPSVRYLPKPYRFSQLIRAIHEELG
ncbi:response regulator [Stenotrophomonas sp. SAM-B]|uniref:response regulator n=1 Tax=Stenotrophomonas sp. SAM-B TaxID=2729141 RepID=UPI0015A3E116|nr:response regulator [Stenotrophomonas sp. SAM-B]NWF32284.1 response regulator [Stenotrophomonas sp. SAM-B]